MPTDRGLSVQPKQGLYRSPASLGRALTGKSFMPLSRCTGRNSPAWLMSVRDGRILRRTRRDARFTVHAMGGIGGVAWLVRSDARAAVEPLPDGHTSVMGGA